MTMFDPSSTKCEVRAHWDPSQQEVCEASHHISSQRPDPVSGFSSEHILDEIVHLVEHHEVNGQTRASVLGGRVACQPGEGVVLLKNKSAEGAQCR